MRANAEALTFDYVEVDSLPENLWPGIRRVLDMIILGDATTPSQSM